MIKIGNFSKLSQISIRMLRHYDEKGLLKPVYIDSQSGYRYYSVGQLTIANRISALKNMGFSIAMISEILKIYNNPEDLKKYLELKKAELSEEVKNTNQRLQLINTAINRIGKDAKAMNYSVILNKLPKRNVISYRTIIPKYEDEGMLWQHIKKVADELDVKFAHPCNSISIYHDEGFKEHDVDVEVQIDVVGDYEDKDEVNFKTVDEIQFASSTFKGGYEKIPDVCETLANWIADNKYDYNGNLFIIYRVSPNMDKNPDNWVTETCFPVK